MINQIYKNGANVTIHDLTDNDGQPSGTQVTIKILFRMTLKTIIIDDEPDSVNLLKIQFTQHCPHIELVGAYTRSVKALQNIEALSRTYFFLI